MLFTERFGVEILLSNSGQIAYLCQMCVARGEDTLCRGVSVTSSSEL